MPVSCGYALFTDYKYVTRQVHTYSLVFIYPNGIPRESGQGTPEREAG